VIRRQIAFPLAFSARQLVLGLNDGTKQHAIAKEMREDCKINGRNSPFFAQKVRPFLAEKGMGPTSAPTDTVNQTFEKYRAYLETLTFIQIDPRLRRQIGWSDIIQDTLVEAWKEFDRIQQLDEAARRGRLRRMLLNNLRDAIRKLLSAGRNVRLETPVEDLAVESSDRLDRQIAVKDSSPLDNLVEEEEALRLLEALSRLERRKREALILQKYHGWKLAEIAEYLGCTTGAVAGLHAHGLKQLRKYLTNVE
jgi:RNA polymerase sigma-70 factor (ECF subfamily)